MAGGRVQAALTANIREVVFGLEDSLVSTLGTMSGVAVGSGDATVVVLAGLVLVFVEALSMSAGSYLSSKSAAELYAERAKQDTTRILSERVSDRESLKQLFERKGFSVTEVKVALQAIGRERKLWLEEVSRSEYRMSPAVNVSPLWAAVVMGGFYIFGGLLVLGPYLLVSLQWALPISVAITVVGLFLLGLWKASLTGVAKGRSAAEMVIVSLVAAGIGILIGRGASMYL